MSLDCRVLLCFLPLSVDQWIPHFSAYCNHLGTMEMAWSPTLDTDLISTGCDLGIWVL